MDLYKFFGLKKDASKEDIKKAYYKKSKKLHPDTNPDPNAQAEFEKANRYYNILYHEQTRIPYDETGFMDEGVKEDEVMKNLLALFNIVIDEIYDIEGTDLFQTMKNKIKAKISNNKGDIQQFEKAISKYEKISKKIYKNDIIDEESFFIATLQTKTNECKNNIIMLNKDIDTYIKMEEILKEFVYKVSTPDRPSSLFGIGNYTLEPKEPKQEEKPIENKEAFKVQIVKCSKNKYWYVNKIGNIFEVIEGDGGYLLTQNNKIKGYVFLDKNDCEIIKK